MWCYDPTTNLWSQLDCIGYIPSPREGHAAALVDDVMYIFGGRTEEGADLGDLAAFKIGSRRWYTFQNMGPSPSPRSGHSMTAVGKTVVVVGGEPSSATTAVNDLELVYCLDTTKIRYPSDSAANPNAAKSQARRPSDVTAQNVVVRSTPSREGSNGPPEARRQTGVPGANPFRSPTGEPTPPNGNPNGPSRLLKSAGPIAPAGPPPQGQPPKPGPGAAGPRPRTTSLERQDQPRISPVASPIPQQVAALREGEVLTANGRRTPPQSPQNPPRSSSRQAEFLGADASRPKPSRPPRSQGGSVDSSMEPTLRQVVPRPSSPPPPMRQNSNPLNRRSSTRNSQTVALLKELDSSRNRNAWYASELELARKAGYVPNASLSPVLDSRGMDTFDDDDKPLIEALLAMRTELANVQTSIDKQAVLAAKQIAEAERQRDAAIQEAVYAKAKLAARVGSANSTPQPDNEKDTGDRVGEISRKLAYALNTQRELQDTLDRISSDYEAERKARKLADDTANAAQKRMVDLENYKQQNASELERLKAELHLAQREAREQSVAAAEAIASAQMLRVEKDEFEYKYTEAVGSSQEHAMTFDSLRGVVAASAGTKALLERKLDEEREQREKVETKLNKLKAEHEARTAELVAATQRLRDAEELAEQHANEARVHRDAVLAGLDKISTKDVAKSDNGDKERVLALQGQVTAANALVKKYQQEADTAADRLRGAEERIAGLEAYQEQASREGVSIRRQLQGTLRDTQSLQAANSDLKQQLAKQQLETNATLVQYNALKDILGERGISPTSAVRSRNSFRGSPREGSPEQMRLRELEVQLTASQNALEETRAQAAVQAQDSETTYRDKLAQLENDYQSAVHYVKGTEKMLKQLKEQLSRYKTENSRLKEQLVELEDKLDAAESSASKSSPRPPADWETHEKNLQAEISRLQTDLRDKTANLEHHLQSIQHELVDAETERDAAMHSTEEAIRRLESSRRDLEQLQSENALLERRALDAEHKVGNLLDQVELSVDNYRRRSRQGDVPGATSVTPTAISTITNGGGNHTAHPGMAMAMGGGPGHTRQESIISDVDSLYDSNPRGAPSAAPGAGGGGGGERNSAALDSLANELETLRSHWEATNKNYRLSNTFDFEANPGVIAKKDEQVSLGLSESLADWRKRLDDSHPAGEGEGRGAESQSPGSGRAR